MSWQRIKTLPWEEPLTVAARSADASMALLYSGLAEGFTGGTSYLLLEPCEVRSGSDWAALPPLPATGDPLPLWVGYLGYGMRDVPERGSPSPIALPDFCLVRYGQLFRFDHARRELTHYTTTDAPAHAATFPTATQTMGNPAPALSSNLTRAEYARIVAATIAQIEAGNFYQANITRKFFGSFAHKPDYFGLFQALAAASPAPYAAYLRHGEVAILSSSPECFLTLDTHGGLTTRPIKGSARRAEDVVADQHIQTALRTSEKNHAENLMIVDLMRNDLAQVSVPGSVQVVEQSALYSYRTIHHLISTIRAQKREGVSAYEAVRACFPAGSMTGAPKIAAMRWCTKEERRERGVYSGAIGWFGAGESCDLSVVIRTLVVAGNGFEFQVGGGIVADSTPEDEWRETIAKARGILAALGLHEADLEAL